MKKFSEIIASILTTPSPIVATPVGNFDQAMMFAKRVEHDDHGHSDSHRRKIGDRAAQRFGSATGGRSKKDTPMIIGIVVGVVIVIGLIALFLRPKQDIPEPIQTHQGFKAIRAYAWDLFMYRQKVSNDDTFPAATENAQPVDAFFVSFSQNRGNPRQGFYFYYSVSADRKSFSLACEPAKDGSHEYCYCAVCTNGGDTEFFEASWKKKGDMEYPVNAQKPQVTSFWSPKDPASVPAD